MFIVLFAAIVFSSCDATRYFSLEKGYHSHLEIAPTADNNLEDHRRLEEAIENSLSVKHSSKHVPLTGQSPEQDFVPPRFSEPLNNITVKAGRDAILHCVVDNLQRFKVAWVRVDTHSILTIHNRVITRNYRIGLSQADGRNWVLRISNVQQSDRGWYMCQINTDPMRFQEAYVEVVVPPDINDTESSTDTTVREGSSVNITCMAHGHPQPHILWRREDGAAIGHGKQKVSAHDGEALHLARVSRLHMGAYLCIASNGIPPSVSKRIMLNVQFPPVLWIPNQLEGTIVGREVKLICQVEAYPIPIVYWTTEVGDILTGNGRQQMSTSIENDYKVTMTLHIRNVSRVHFGGYRCVVRNSLGETDGLIRVYEVPAATRFPVITEYFDSEMDDNTQSDNTLFRSPAVSDQSEESNRPNPTMDVQVPKLQRNGSSTSSSTSSTSQFLLVLLVFPISSCWLPTT